MPIIAGYERVVAAAREGRVLVCVEQGIGGEFQGESAHYFTGDERCVVSAQVAVSVSPHPRGLVVVDCKRREQIVGRIRKVTAYAFDVNGILDWMATVNFTQRYLGGYMPGGSMTVPLGRSSVELF